MLLQNFGGAINCGPAKEVAHMEMNAEAVFKSPTCRNEKETGKSHPRDKLRFMHLFFVMGQFREGD